MFAISELAMPRVHNVITICSGTSERRKGYEEVKAYFLMMSANEKYEHYKYIYLQPINIINRLNEC